MDYIFEITDKSGRKIHLSKERWSHIRKKHPEIEDSEIIEQTLKNPNKITNYGEDPTVYYYYRFYKDRKPQNRFLCVSIKYLNDHGYITTAYFNKRIK